MALPLRTDRPIQLEQMACHVNHAFFAQRGKEDSRKHEARLSSPAARAERGCPDPQRMELGHRIEKSSAPRRSNVLRVRRAPNFVSALRR